MTDQEPNIRLAVPFFCIADMVASMQFYTDKLGFQPKHEWASDTQTEWCWLQRDAVSIMLQEPRDKGQLHTGLQGKGVSICFQCADALALYREFTANGIKIKDPFVGNGMWVVQFTDPDGYKLDFESPTNVPEETKYSEWFK